MTDLADTPDRPRGEHYAVTHACSILMCEDARRRGVEPPAMALADMHRALRNLTDDAAGEAVEAANRLLDLLWGRQ